MSQLSRFVPIPETHLPCGRIVPAFEVSQFLCAKATFACGHMHAHSVAELPPWTWITYTQAVRACEASGWSLIRESQWLAIAYDVARRPDNWSGGVVGAGRLLQGLHKDSVDQPSAALLAAGGGEHRWKTLSNYHRICDFGGNAWSWIHDDIQGAPDGSTRIVEPHSPSLTTAPYPPRQKGMGIRPIDRRAWDGRALIRGGSWRSGKDAGAFALYAAILPFGYCSVGFRATRPITGDHP